MAKTIAEIAVGVLEEIGRLPDGQVAPASQLQKVKDAYTGLYEDLFNNSLVNWAEDDSIPEFAVYPVEQMLAGRVAGKFGVDATKYLVLVDTMEAKLAENLANPSEQDVTPMVYF